MAFVLFAIDVGHCNMKPHLVGNHHLLAAGI